ncbi:odorant receptor Or2-like [Harpegnathos saltator]|uniref:odorant receptor Or2-like n=1 Tax=Harpegnathos saltator TaxID=610380 RepID=UPI000DBEE8DD|nr:odorant receptor Or2-like [Harpegnathos saltator]
MSSFKPNKEHLLHTIISGDFDLKDKERPGQPKKFQGAELQALLDEDDTQTQQQMTERLNVGRRTICDRLHAMGKIQKAGKWIPHPLNDRHEKAKNGMAYHIVCSASADRYAYMLNKKFARIVPGEFAMVTIVMTYDLIHMTMTSSSAAYIQGIMFLASTLAAIFYYCWFGNELKLKSLQLSDNIYNMEWTMLDDNMKKGLLMIMNRATIPIEFTSTHMPMNLESFVAVLKMSYSLFNVLIQSRK